MTLLPNPSLTASLPQHAARHQAAATDSLRFERRSADRHPVQGRITSLQYLGDHRHTQQRKIASLQLVNMSSTGLCAVSQEHVAPGAAVTLFFPPHGNERGFDAIGHVVRCTSRPDTSHELGIRFDNLPAA